MDRRSFLATTGAAATALTLPLGANAAATRGRLKQGVCPNVFANAMRCPNERDPDPRVTACAGDSKLSFDDGVKMAAKYGVKGYDFVVDPKNFPAVKRHGMQLSILGPELNGTFALRPPMPPPGWAATGQKAGQGEYLQGVMRAIDAAAANDCPNVLVQCGARSATLSYSEGADNTVEFLNKVKGHAEEKGVAIQMEILNNKGFNSPPTSLFDHIDWGVDVCKRVDSKSVRILYDIFHVQLDEGNIANSIRKNFQWIGHVHTGSVPGRTEIWRNDEIDYHYIAQVLAELNFQGFVSHEWHPSPGTDVEEALRKGIALMVV